MARIDPSVLPGRSRASFRSAPSGRERCAAGGARSSDSAISCVRPLHWHDKNRLGVAPGRLRRKL